MSSNEPSNEPEKAPPPSEHHKVSPTELMASAQTLSGAEQSMVKHEAIDKTKVAEAADNVLHAAEEYGKLDEKGYGSYVDKADAYLHKFKSEGGHSDSQVKEEEEEEEEVKGSAAAGKKEESDDSGFGGVMKLASGFMK